MRASLSPDPLAELAPGNLVQVYARLREAAPVHWSASFGGWVLTRYADAAAVLTDPTYLADDPVARFDRLERRGGPALGDFRTLLSNTASFTNPPRHVTLRKFMSRLFQGSEVGALRGILERRMADILNDARRGGGVDVAVEFGRDLAIFTVSVFLGLPLEDCHAAAATARNVAGIFDLTPQSIKDLRTANARAGELLDYFEAEIGRGRARGEGDRFSRLVSRADRELEMGDRELAGLLIFIFIAGQETTAAGIPAAIVMLLQRPDLRESLVADRAKIPAAAREFLRLVAPFQYVVRIASRDGEIGGELVMAGERVTIVLAAANRDPEAFPGPDAIEVNRLGLDSLAFGHGAYRCLGAGLAQMETEVALAAVLAHPDLGLAPGAVEWETRTRVPAMTRAWADFV
jgi:cytochrome P450